MSGRSRITGLLGTWHRERQRFAALAMMASILTGSLAIRLGEAAWYPYGAVLFVVLAGVALVFPAAIAGQVISGQILVVGLLLGPFPPPLAFTALVVAGVLLTSEVLAVVARMDTPHPTLPRKDGARAAVSTVLGGCVFVGAMLMNDSAGPSGFLALALASSAIGVLAVILVKTAR